MCRVSAIGTTLSQKCLPRSGRNSDQIMFMRRIQPWLLFMLSYDVVVKLNNIRQGI